MGTTERDSRHALAHVECHLTIDVIDDVDIVLQIAPSATSGDVATRTLTASVEGRPLEVREDAGERGGVVHLVRSPAGTLTIDLLASLEPAHDARAPTTVELDTEQITYLRQSRYCPSDHLSGFAAYELGHLGPSAALLSAVGDWVGSRLTYEEGSSGPLDSAVDSLFRGRGVCRDFAHLAITVLRALDVPSRLVSVYAPGLSPMDLHAVVEAHVEGRWCILDPTRLAPRPSLVRVATGRDAADTAFLTSIGGEARLLALEFSAMTDGDLPTDDHTGLISLA